MTKSSKVISVNGKTKASHMVGAMRSISGKVSMKTPSGQFGRKVKIDIGELKITNELDLEFTVPFDDNIEANEAEVKIYNLKKSTVGLIKVNEQISITAGYGKDTGVIFSGVVSSVKTRWSGLDKVTTIYALDDVSRKEKDIASIAFNAGVKASYILKTLVGKVGLPIAVFSTRRDKTYTEAVTFEGGLMAGIKQYAEVCGVSAYINKQKIYVRHLTDGDNLDFTVKESTGLVDSPEEFEEEISSDDYTDMVSGVSFKMLLEHRITTASIVNLESRDYTGRYRVREGKHVCTDSDFYTEVTAIEG